MSDCTTGVTNELEGCEPVGVTPTDLQTTVVGINGPAVVNLPPRPTLPTPVGSVYDTTIATIGEPTLPATGPGDTISTGILAAVFFAIGFLIVKATR